MNLYDLTADYLRLAQEMADEPDAQKAADLLECVHGAVQDKAASVALYCRGIESDMKVIDDAIERLQERKQALQAKHDRLHQYLADNMRRCGITRVEHPLLTLKFAKNPARVVVDDEAAIPADYFTQPPAPPPKLDKKALLAAIKSGAQISGAHLEQVERLVIE